MSANPPDLPSTAACGGADDCFDWPGSTGPVNVRLYEGSPERSSALLVFFPPGGFVEADLDASDACYKTVAMACRATMLAPSYAVAPERPFPAAVEDAHAVLVHAARLGARIRGWTGEHLFVGGMEAGGNLAAVSALVCRDRLGPTLAGQVLLMPMLDPDTRDGTPDRAPAGYRGYLPRLSDRVHPYATPLASRRLTGLPPALFVTADGDALAAEARTYADRLEKAGVDVRRVAITPQVMANVDDRCTAAADDPAVNAIAEFIKPFLVTTAIPSRTAPRTTKRSSS